MTGTAQKTLRLKVLLLLCIFTATRTFLLNRCLATIGMFTQMDIQEGDLTTILLFFQDKESRLKSRKHTLQPRQRDTPQEQGNRTCSTCPAVLTARHATRTRKQNMQHTPCSPDSETRHKKKETEHATHAPTARHATRTRKQNMQHTPCSPGSKTRHKKKETEQGSTLFLNRKPISVLQIRIIMPQRKAI
jgi:hypothetical protein